MNRAVTCREKSNGPQQRVSDCDARSFSVKLLSAELFLQNSSRTLTLAELLELAERAVIKWNNVGVVG
jgi:hypothetical protein